MMKPNKVGQIAKFRTHVGDKDPNQLYVVLEIKGESDSARVDLKELNAAPSDPSISSISSVRLNDLVVVNVDTRDLIGHTVIIEMSDYSRVSGIVIEVSKAEILIDLTNGIKGVETEVWVTVTDVNGKEHMGYLSVN